jgi:hypothetical protein
VLLFRIKSIVADQAKTQALAPVLVGSAVMVLYWIVIAVIRWVVSKRMKQVSAQK